MFALIKESFAAISANALIAKITKKPFSRKSICNLRCKISTRKRNSKHSCYIGITKSTLKKFVPAEKVNVERSTVNVIEQERHVVISVLVMAVKIPLIKIIKKI